MSTEMKSKTSPINGRLWGARAPDWAGVQEGMVRPVDDAVFERTGLGYGTRYLDLGCGAGMAAQIAAGRGAKVSGLDAAEALLAIARNRVPEGDFRHGDLEDLPFEHQSFDLVTGFHSIQYAGNPVVAVREARRVVGADGVVAVVTWGDPVGMEAAALVTALGALLPPPQPGAPGPFALSNEMALRELALAADLKPINVVDIESLFVYPDVATAVRGLNSSGVAIRAIEHR